MNSRERGNALPVISVAVGAFLVLVMLPSILHRHQSARMATVDAQVTIGDVASELSIGRDPALYRWPDSEVHREAERLRDLTAVAIASSTYVIEGSMTGRPSHAEGEILTNIARRKLIPDQWRTKQPAVLKTRNGIIHLRYSPRTLTIEVLSVPGERTDGPALLIRIPDSENTGVGIRYFESMQLDGIIYPPPFAPIPEIIAAGWRPRLFKQTQLVPNG